MVKKGQEKMNSGEKIVRQFSDFPLSGISGDMECISLLMRSYGVLELVGAKRRSRFCGAQAYGRSKLLHSKEAKTMHKRLKRFVILLSLAVLLNGWVFLSGSKAGGIAVQFSDVVLENIRPGGVYNLRELRGLVYTVINRYDSAKDFEVVVEKPHESQLEKEYEPIPDPLWIRVIPNKFHLSPGESAHCTIIIAVPNEEKYVGHHYQFMLTSRAKAGTFAGGGLAMMAEVTYRLRINVGTSDPGTIEADKKRKKYFTLNFHLEPESLFVREKIDLGKEIFLGQISGISKFFSPKGVPGVKVLNLGPETVKLKFKSVEFGFKPGIAEEYEPSPQPDFLQCRVKMVKVKPNQIKDVPLVLKIPDNSEYKGEKYAFLIKAELVDADVPLEIYARVYIHTRE